MKMERNNWLSGVGIVVIAAVLVELISVVQYERIRHIMEEDLNIRSRISMGAAADRVGFLLEGKDAAVLEEDLSWLGDTLNARQQFRYSFLLLLTEDGKPVAAPPPSEVPQADIDEAFRLIREGRDISDDKRISIRSTTMKTEPYWQVAQVYYIDEVMAPIRKMRRSQMLLILLGLGILGFMIERFVRSENKLRAASAEQARISGELSVARNIQQEMLPKSFPEGIYGLLEPAREVGGDLYDFFRRDGKLFFCIGDVSGKGVPSAMLMSVVHSLFRMVSRQEESPARILAAMNRQISERNESNMFVTLFVGCLDLYTGNLHFGNAGHDRPFLLSSSVSRLPAKANLPLGVFPDTVFVEESLVVSPGDTLVLYTDGLSEAKNHSREAFGRTRVQEILNACLSRGKDHPQQMVQALSEAAHDFVGDAPQSDDLALLVVKYEPGDLVREQLILSNMEGEVARLGTFVKAFCDRLPLDSKTASGLRLALEESVVNVINYAYPAGETGEVRIYAESNRKEVRFTIVDSGTPFDPTAVLSADITLDVQNRPIGGLGIHLTRKLMDSVSYCRKHGKNVLTLTKNIS